MSEKHGQTLTKFTIVRVDTDYRSYVGEEELVFHSIDEAQRYCDEMSGGGDHYFISQQEPVE